MVQKVNIKIEDEVLHFSFNDYHFIFDSEDSHLFEGSYIWSVDRGYLRRGIYISPEVGIRNTPMHRLVMEVSNPIILVDHKNGKRSDNRKSNLRLTDNLGNSRNVSKWSKPTSSKYKGVSLTDDGTWMMSIRTGGKEGRIRERYDDEDIAGYVYNLYALEYFGEFANLNDVKTFTEHEIAKSAIKRKKNASKNSSYKGVSWKESQQKWLAQFYYQKKRYRVGIYDTEEEAFEALLSKKKEMGIL